jgi:hypothetical protein
MARLDHFDSKFLRLNFEKSLAVSNFSLEWKKRRGIANIAY